jgi:hypothetical protein
MKKRMVATHNIAAVVNLCLHKGTSTDPRGTFTHRNILWQHVTPAGTSVFWYTWDYWVSYMREPLLVVTGRTTAWWAWTYIQCVSLAGSPGKYWFTKRTKVQYICTLVYICMSYLYEMLLSQEVLELSSLSVNTQLNTTLHVSTTWKQAGCASVSFPLYYPCLVLSYLFVLPTSFLNFQNT